MGNCQFLRSDLKINFGDKQSLKSDRTHNFIYYFWIQALVQALEKKVAQKHIFDLNPWEMANNGRFSQTIIPSVTLNIF